MKTKATISVATLLALAACGQVYEEQGSDLAISGGRAADATSPGIITRSVVSLAQNSEFFHKTKNYTSAFCSGVIISESLVLTAAHCVEFLDRQMTLVVFANTMNQALKDTRNRIRPVVGFERHSGYPNKTSVWGNYTMNRSPYAEGPEKWMRENPGLAPHDLAVVRFSGGLPPGYVPVKIASADFPTPSMTTLAGFGITGAFNNSNTGTLRYVEDVKVHPIDADTKSRNFLPVAETQDVTTISFNVGPKGACPGDSGGPAFAAENGSLTLLGILSLGEGERYDEKSALTYCLGHKKGSTSKIGNLYTDVRAYGAWIADVKARLDFRSQNPR